MWTFFQIRISSSSAEELKNDNVSATEVVEYLKDFAKEMTSEVKSEIREAVNEIISPELCQIRKNSPPDILERRQWVINFKKISTHTFSINV